MAQKKLHDIKREQKKSLFFREISSIVQPLTQENKDVSDLYVSRVDLSADSGILYIYFATYGVEATAKEVFDKSVKTLILYKPSIRKALASRINSRYCPDLLFLFDDVKEKERHIHGLLDKVQDELSTLPTESLDSENHD
jgi:ribosome-binding factor A